MYRSEHEGKLQSGSVRLLNQTSGISTSQVSTEFSVIFSSAVFFCIRDVSCIDVQGVPVLTDQVERWSTYGVVPKISCTHVVCSQRGCKTEVGTRVNLP